MGEEAEDDEVEDDYDEEDNGHQASRRGYVDRYRSGVSPDTHGGHGHGHGQSCTISNAFPMGGGGSVLGGTSYGSMRAGMGINVMLAHHHGIGVLGGGGMTHYSYATAGVGAGCWLGWEWVGV